MKISVNTLKPGFIIEHQNELWRVNKTQHVKPGKGGAYVQAELKNVRSASKLNERFRASETIERARLEQKRCTFLYREKDDFHFMDDTSYEQFSLHIDFVGEDVAVFLSDGLSLHVEFHEEDALAVMLPSQLTLEIAEAEAVVKGQTAASSYKTATLENGLPILVPPYIEAGEKIVVNTSEKTFVERAKS